MECSRYEALLVIKDGLALLVRTLRCQTFRFEKLPLLNSTRALGLSSCHHYRRKHKLVH